MGKIVCATIVFLCFLVRVECSLAQDMPELDREFSNSAILGRHFYGFSLYDLDSNRMLYGRNQDKLFTPASNTKVYTLHTALKNLGDSLPGVQYVERGDSLIFWGTGDPTFLHDKLDNGRVFNFLKSTGKTLYYASQDNIEGPYRDGWSVEDYRFDYQPEISVFPIYGNLVTFRSKSSGLYATPVYFDKKIELKERSSRYFGLTRQQHNNTFQLSTISIPKGYYAQKPFIWSDTLFVNLLSDTLHREVKLLSHYAKPSDLKTVYSVPKNRVLREMMLPSDNFLAEHLTMLAADARFGDFLTDSLRTEMNANYYAKMGDSIALFDGSGLSTYNRISPNNMIGLLRSLKEFVPDEYELKMFFPAGGVDGTIKRSYSIGKNGPFVWAKTGTLNGVYCQSGYITTSSGRKFAFSFLNNNIVQSASTVRREMVRIVTYIYQHY